MIQLRKSKGTFLIIAFATLLACGLSNCTPVKEKGITERIAHLEKEGQLIVQLAELEIDPLQLEAYLALLKVGIETSVANEPGVLSLYAMTDKDNPANSTVVEIYADQGAYESHISSAHFQKYKNGTLKMVDSLKLTRTIPVVFAAKGN